MFNSELISIAKELNGGIFDRDNPIIHAVYEMHRDIIQFAIDLWKDDDPSDEGFKHHFELDFPPGFINRDITRAKQVIYDLLDIAEGETVRHELAPIYTYVMYQLIYYSCAFMKDEGELKNQFPKEVKEYLKEKKIAPRSEIYQCVKRWFVDESEMYDDFQDTYNEDYTDSYFAEMVASMYLEDEWAEGKLACLGVDIEEFLDLLPNDLYIRVKKKLDTEKEKLSRQNENDKVENKTYNPDLTMEIINACIKISEEVTTHALDEDSINRQLRNNLDSSLHHFDYSIQDQTQRGYSSTGKKAGEIDLRIEKRDTPVAICECLIHKNEKYLHEHIQKAVGSYNQIGYKNIYIIIYIKCKNFVQAWGSIETWVKECDVVHEWQEKRLVELGGIRYAVGEYGSSGHNGIIHYIGVNIFPASSPEYPVL